MAEIGRFFVNGFSVPIVQDLSYTLSQQNEINGDGDASALLKRYIRPENERPQQQLLREQSLPVIDMSLLTSQEKFSCEMQSLHKACQQLGFFQIVNHGIPESLLDRTKRVSREFFQLPLQEKQKYFHRPGSLEGYGQVFVFSEDQPLDWADILLLTLLPEHTRNLEMWAQLPPDFRKTTEEYVCEVEKLVLRLLQLFAQNLGLTPDTRLSDVFKRGAVTTKWNYYPPCPLSDSALGFGPHSDGGLLTVLLQDDETVGLHIHADHGQHWMPVKPIPGALVVNIGDSLQVITNGRYRSIEHRAVTNKDTCRLSIAAFCVPGAQEIIDPLPEMISQQCPAAYRTFSRAEFLEFRSSNRFQGKKHNEEFMKTAHNDE